MVNVIDRVYQFFKLSFLIWPFTVSQSKVCYHSVNVISFSRSQSGHIKRVVQAGYLSENGHDV
jgi:hypothetical protein